MSDLVRTALPIALLLLLFCIEVPVAFALSIAGMFGIYLFTDLTAASSNLAAIPFTRASTYTLTVVPMFMLVGVLVSRSAILEGAFEVAQRMVKRLPGGMGVATVMAATFLGGITGSSVADAATVGRIAIGEMAKRGYDMAYAAAIVAAAATVAILLPTSIALAVFGVVTGVSVGKLLLGGLIPALCTSLAYVCVSMVAVREQTSSRHSSAGASSSAYLQACCYLGSSSAASTRGYLLQRKRGPLRLPRL